MQVLRAGPEVARAIDRFGSHGATSVAIAAGSGEARVHVVHFDAGGEIGPHETGFAQLFVVLAGTGWVAGPDDAHVEIGAGEAAHFPRGVRHSKGATTAMSAVMIQVFDLDPFVDAS